MMSKVSFQVQWDYSTDELTFEHDLGIISTTCLHEEVLLCPIFKRGGDLESRRG